MSTDKTQTRLPCNAIVMLPCPFCGNLPTMRVGVIDDWDGVTRNGLGVFHVQCSGALICDDKSRECQVQPSTHGYMTPEAAAEAWNARAT